MKSGIGEFSENLSRKFKYHSNLAHFCVEGEMFQTNVEKIETHILYIVTVFLQFAPSWDNAAKYCIAGQDTDGNMVHSHCMLDT